MKTLSKYILALLSAFLVVPAFAANDAGDDSARYYRNNAEEYNGKMVDVDVAFVTRINRKDRIDEIVFFVAHTVDDDNSMRGGPIVVAVLEGDAKSFMRKFGTAVDRSNGKVDTKRLRGTFHLLPKGRVYIDESGEAHALIEAHRKEHGDAAIPATGDTPAAGPGPKKKKRF